MDNEQRDCECCGRERPGLSRRSALARLWFGVLGALGLATLAGCPGGSTYGREAAQHEMAGDAKADGSQVQQLEFDKRKCRFGQALELELAGRKIVVAHNKDTEATPVWVALDRQCTHNRCLVGYDPETNEFVCPCHGSRFNFAGEPVSGPARKPLAAYRIEEGQVNVVVFNKNITLPVSGEKRLVTGTGG